MTSMIFWFDRMTPDDKIFNEDPSTVIFEKKTENMSSKIFMEFVLDNL